MRRPRILYPAIHRYGRAEAASAPLTKVAPAETFRSETIGRIESGSQRIGPEGQAAREPGGLEHRIPGGLSDAVNAQGGQNDSSRSAQSSNS